MAEEVRFSRSGDQQSIARQRLRQAVEAVREEEARLQALEAAQLRAGDQLCAAQSTVIEAESILQQTERIDPEHLAYSFAAGETIERPIAETRARLDRAKSELEHMEEIQQALESEMQRVQRRLRLRRSSVYEALADVVCESPEFARLFSELENTWARLRGLRKCFRAIQDSLSGHMPGPLMSRWQTVIALDYDVSYPLDEQPAQLWSQALERLLIDPDAILGWVV